MSTLMPVGERIPAAPGRDMPQHRVLVVLSFGGFLTSFDAGAMTAALPLIRHEFARGIGEVQ
jgi:hypothetical protein